MATRVCEVVLDVLASAGARDVFGITGDALNPLLDAIARDDRFRWLGMRHEENAAYAACAQAELTGGLGVCAGTTGPGAVHLLNGLYNARKEGAGVVAITGQVPRAERGSEYHKEIDLAKLFDDVCAYQAIVESPAQLPRMAELAVQRALLGEVVRIEIPIDVMDARVSDTRAPRPLVRGSAPVPPLPEAVAAAAEAIGRGERVTLFCGAGCRAARDRVLALARHLEAPIAHTLRAKDVFDGEIGEACVVGMTGLIGSPAGYHAVEDSDVLVMLGTDFPYDEFIPSGRTIVQVDRRPERIGRRAAVGVPVAADVGLTVDALLARVAPGRSAAFRDGLLGLRDKWRDQMREQASLERTDEPLHPQLLARVVSDRAADDAFFAVDVGECTVWTARQIEMRGERRMAGSFNWGSVGSGLPVGLGAAALGRHAQTWVICGDGGFGMSLTDFVTAVRYGWAVKVLVFDNSELGFVKMETEVAGLARNPIATGLVNPDFVAFARACGGDGVRVERASEIVPAVEAAIASSGPFVIDAIVSAGELTMPPHVEVGQAFGFGISKVKEAIMGLRGDHAVWETWREEFRSLLGR